MLPFRKTTNKESNDLEALAQDEATFASPERTPYLIHLDAAFSSPPCSYIDHKECEAQNYSTTRPTTTPKSRERDPNEYATLERSFLNEVQQPESSAGHSSLPHHCVAQRSVGGRWRACRGHGFCCGARSLFGCQTESCRYP